MSPKSSKPVVALDVDRSEHISPADFKNKFGEIQGELRSTTDAARGTALNIGIAVAAVVVLSVFAFGLRRGKRRTTVVEIRRV